MNEEKAPPGVDTSVPSVARVYDMLLGGKDNFAVDREAVSQVLKLVPGVPEMARSNRRWARHVVRWLARDVGIDQFLDVGSGLPTAENTHEIVQQVNPDAVVVYVDNDPVVIAHGRALLDDNRRAFFAAGDLTKPYELLTDPDVARHLEFDRPIALLQCATMHFVPDHAQAIDIIGTFMDKLPSGSYLCLSQMALPDADDDRYELFMEAVGKYGSISTAFTPRRNEQILAMVDGLELVPPGLAPVDDWHSERPTSGEQSMFAEFVIGVVARKP